MFHNLSGYIVTNPKIDVKFQFVAPKAPLVGELSPQVTEGCTESNICKPLRPFGAPPLQGRQSGKYEFT